MFTANMKNTAAFVFTEDDEEKIPIGTGFWLEKDNESYFVTAKHMIEDEAEIYIRMNTEKGLLFQEVELTKNQPLYHENPAIDIAIIPLKPRKGAKYFMINAGMLIDNEFVEKVGVIEGDDVFFIGLLPQFFGKLKNTPVVRTGKVALVTDELFEDEDGEALYFYIEAHCFPGNSGSPVFMRMASMDANGNISYAGNQVLLLGVMCGYLNQYREIRKGAKISKFNFDENVHIAMVSPAHGILDIIDS